MTLHQALVAYVLSAMTAWMPPAHWQQASYRTIADAIARGADDDPDDAVQLAAIGSFESGYRENAVGKRGERGVFQLLSFPERKASCAPWAENPGRWTHPQHKLPELGPCTLVEQARIALYRWKVMGRCSFTGEASTAPACPLADHRYLRAFDWVRTHPFTPPPAAPDVFADAAPSR
jgi:hypothetical protein